jgi:hypothetical protein
LVLSLNVHRRHLTPKQKRVLIAKLVKVKPESSDRTIAAQVKLDHKTVGKVRGELERRGEIPHVAGRTDSTGRRQAAHRRPKPNATATERAPAEQVRADAPAHVSAGDFVTSAEQRKAEHAAQELAERKAAEEPPPCEYAHIIWREFLTAEHREAIERWVLDAFFETATAAEIYARLPAAKHAEMLAAFSIETARAVFGERLCAPEPEKGIPEANPRIDPNAIGLIEDGVTAQGQAPEPKPTPTAGAARCPVEANDLLIGWRKLSADKLEARINEILQAASDRRHPRHFKDHEWRAVDRMRTRLRAMRKTEQALAVSQTA